MKLIFTRKDGSQFYADLPRRKTKHRIPRVGEIVEYTDENMDHYGIVSRVKYHYKQVLGDLRGASVSVYVDEANR